MKRVWTFLLAVCCTAAVYGSPYGKALQQARKVAGHQSGNEFRQIWMQMGEVIRQNKGCLPGPAGVEGLRNLCGPGMVSPALLKINDFSKLTEKNCTWAYVGGVLGDLRTLPRDGGFPILFSKAVPGVSEIKVLLSDGTVKTLDAKKTRKAVSVVNTLRRSSRHAKHPAWKKLAAAAGQIDRAK